VIKLAPSPSRILAMVIFTLVCFGSVLYLWVSFGGPVPLAPEGYRFELDFEEATLLTDNADVRISGVSVGRVVHSRRVGDLARAEIEMDAKYAPIPRNTRATLRQKTGIGETYVELSPGDPQAGTLPDHGRLPGGAVVPTPQIDEVLGELFDPTTRDASRQLIAGIAEAVRGRGQDISQGLAHANPAVTETGDVLGVMNRERAALREIVRDGGFVLATVGRRQGELSDLLAQLEKVLAATARRDHSLEETIRILPTTLRELRPTFTAIEALSREAAPVLRELRPAARAAGPALRDAAAVAPDLRGAFTDIDRLVDVARPALPATTRVVDSSRPVFQRLSPALRDLLPAVDYLGLYRQEFVTFFANIASSMQGGAVASDGRHLHYLRTLVPGGPETVVAADKRFGSNRHNPYGAPRWLDRLADGLESIDCSHTGNPAPSGSRAPPCRVQNPLPFRGRATAFPQLRRDPR
jgi:virulence factor Mce-like protein